MSKKMIFMFGLTFSFGISAPKDGWAETLVQGVCPNGDCEVVQYALAKATGLTQLNINNATSAEAIGQYYNAPQAITVYGADFYAYKINAASNPIEINIEVYLADVDLLPVGAPLVSKAVSIDIDDSSLVLDDLRTTTLFDEPVTVSQPYVIVLSNDSADGVGVVLNNYNGTPPDGLEEYLSSAKITGSWLNGSDVNIGGVPLDADVLLEPLVSYSLDTDFTMIPAVDDGSHFVSLTNNSSPVLVDRMYNLAAFLGQDVLSHNYDFGDGTEAPGPDASHTYRCGGAYDITKTDTLFGWKRDLTSFNTQQWGSGPLFTNTTYVDHSTTGKEDGCDWANAFTTIQPAVDIAGVDGEILIAEGTYETTDEIIINQALSFKGGFPSGGGEQNITDNPTVIEAIIAGPADRHRLIQANHLNGVLSLEGLTLQNGITNTGGKGGAINTLGNLNLKFVNIFNNSAVAGGGIYSQNGSVTATNSSLTFNQADDSGGGIYIQNGSLLLTNVLISDNAVLPTMPSLPAFGGGIYSGSGNMTLINTQVNNNSAESQTGDIFGGGLYNSNGDALLINSQISKNTASSQQGSVMGGGLFNDDGAVQVINSLIYSNEILSPNSNEAEGGGMHSTNLLTLVNSAVIANNISAEVANASGAGIFGNTDMRNSILWSNTNPLGVPSEHEDGFLISAYSLIKGEDLTADNGLDASVPGFEPMFFDEMNGDFSLALGSPLIDSADFNSLPLDDFDVDGDGDLMERLPLDIAGFSREFGVNIDIGPYEFSDLIFRDGFE